MGRKSAHKIIDFYNFSAGPSKSGLKEFEKWKWKKYAFTFIFEMKSEFYSFLISEKWLEIEN